MGGQPQWGSSHTKIPRVKDTDNSGCCAEDVPESEPSDAAGGCKMGHPLWQAVG